MSHVVATYNIKGGVGKTSAAVNLAYLAAREGFRVLLWDLDPQGASTFLFRVKPKVRGGGRRLVRGKSDVSRLIRGTDFERLDLLPADFSYRHMDLALDATKRPTRRLARVLAPLRDDYDWVFLDCPPSISLVSESVFEAAGALLVPLIPATLSSRMLAQLSDVVHGPQVLAFFSMVDWRKRLHREVMASLRDSGAPVLDTVIPAAADVERMGAVRDVIASFAPRGRAATAYEALWAEVRERVDGGGGAAVEGVRAAGRAMAAPPRSTTCAETTNRAAAGGSDTDDGRRLRGSEERRPGRPPRQESPRSGDARAP